MAKQSTILSRVDVQLKPYPFFVSDAIPSDIEHTLSVLAAAPEANQRKVAGELPSRRRPLPPTPRLVPILSSFPSLSTCLKKLRF